MGIFSKKSTDDKDAGKKTKKAVKNKEEVLTPESQVTKSEAQTTAAAAKGQAGSSYKILQSPRVSEKAAIMASKNVYVFNVPTEANKVEIAKAVKALYGVVVENVRTARGIGKFVSRGRIMGQRNKWKKAYVTVKSGQKIDLYEGV